MMKRSFRDEWTTALRSGEHVQGRVKLDHDGKKCCLGVRCHLDVAAGLMEVSRSWAGGTEDSFSEPISSIIWWR